MPTYAYRCSGCGHSFDVRQSFQDESLTVCPQCDGRLHKEYGSVGVTFKGSGFYRTDSRGKGGKSSSSVPAKASEKSAEKSGGESKPTATKPESTAAKPPKPTATS